MDELTTFVNNTDSEYEFSKTGKISNVSCVSCGSHVPQRTPLLQVETSSQNTYPSEYSLLTGLGEGGRSGRNRILLTTATGLQYPSTELVVTRREVQPYFCTQAGKCAQSQLFLALQQR